MMPTSTQNNRNSDAIVLEKIENLRCDIADMKKSLKDLYDSFNEFQRASLVDRTQIRDEVKSALRRIDTHDVQIETIASDIKKLEDSMRPLIFANKVLAFVSVALGSSVIILIWEIVLHKVQLVFP
jgi:hypothetical protein